MSRLVTVVLERLEGHHHPQKLFIINEQGSLEPLMPHAEQERRQDCTPAYRVKRILFPREIDPCPKS